MAGSPVTVGAVWTGLSTNLMQYIALRLICIDAMRNQAGDDALCNQAGESFTVSNNGSHPVDITGCQ